MIDLDLSTLAERIEAAIDYAGLTQKDLADRIGVASKTIQRDKNAGRAPRKRLAQIAEATGVHLSWLESGRGDMVDARRTATGHAEMRLVPLARGDDEDYSIPLVDVSAGPGAAGVNIHEVAHTERLPGWYIRQEYGVEPRRLVSFRVNGDSMNGDPAHIAPGDIVRGALFEPGSMPKNGVVYVLWGPTGIQLKRLYFGEHQSDDGSTIRRICLWSDNARAGRDWIDLSLFQQDYRIIAELRKVERDL